MPKSTKNLYKIKIIVAALSLLLLPTTTLALGAHSNRFFYDNGPESAALHMENETTQDEGEEIPLEFHSKLDDVNGTEEFIDKFVPKDTIEPQLGIIGKNLKRNVERASAVMPVPANCMPEDTTVPLMPLNPSKDPKIIYWPKCTRVKRCGGCCNSELTSCQPVEKEYINFAVTKYRYGVTAPLRGKEIVVVEQHTKCQCGCRIKAEVSDEHCNAYQEYHEDQCSCICTNEDAKRKCLQQDHKIWDELACRCICREPASCTTGTLFDESQCKCIDPAFGSNSGITADRRRFIVKAVAVDPDNSTIYDSN